jgi:hypothetical protein
VIINQIFNRFFLLGYCIFKVVMTTGNSDKVTVKQLLSLIPDQALSSLAANTGVDYQAKVLFGKSMFYLLLYGLAESERASLRSLEDIFNSRRFKLLFNLDVEQTTRYNSISDRLRTKPIAIYSKPLHY